MSQFTITIITSVISLLGILTVGVTVPLYLMARAEKSRREDSLEADRLRREDREAQWERQDELAARAARSLTESARKIADTQVQTNGKLDVIHTLVNSNLTAAMEAEHDAVKRELAMMREVIGLRRELGQEPSPEAETAVAATQAKLDRLAEMLAERKKAQDQADQYPEGDKDHGGTG